jgi:hypothetical protein
MLLSRQSSLYVPAIYCDAGSAPIHADYASNPLLAGSRRTKSIRSRATTKNLISEFYLADFMSET